MFLTQWESEEFVTTQNSALHHNAFATLSGEIAVGYPHHFLDYRNRKRGKIIFVFFTLLLYVRLHYIPPLKIKMSSYCTISMFGTIFRHLKGRKFPLMSKRFDSMMPTEFYFKENSVWNIQQPSNIFRFGWSPVFNTVYAHFVGWKFRPRLRS